MTTPLFSVIVPARNEEAFLGRALESIYRQTCDDWEMIVVVNGSTDGTVEIAKNHMSSRQRVFVTDRAGRSRARNIGIEDARAPYVVFLDADDTYTPDALGLLAEAIWSGRPWDFVCSVMTPFPRETLGGIEDVEPWKFSLGLENFRHCLELFDRSPFLRSQCGKAYRREVLNENGIRFNENLESMEDWHFNEQFYRVMQSSCLLDSVIYNVGRRRKKHDAKGHSHHG